MRNFLIKLLGGVTHLRKSFCGEPFEITNMLDLFTTLRNG